MSVLAGKRVLITGAASGIGRATAELAVREGARVLICDIDATRGQEAADSIGAEFFGLDVADAEGWQNAAQLVSDRFGGLDILYLNAGRMMRPPGASALSGDVLSVLTAERYRAVMAVNCDGVMLGLLRMLPLLRGANAATVLVSGSATGLMPFAADPVYAMSKHAITGLVRSLAPALMEERVRLLAICPAGIETGMTPPDIRRHYEATNGFASSAYAAHAVVHVIKAGSPGDIWVVRSTDAGIWPYPFLDLPSPLPGSIEPVPIQVREV